MSKRPWPDDREPSAEELIEWCRNGMTADVTPFVERLLADSRAAFAVRAFGRVGLAELVAVGLDVCTVVRDGREYVEIPKAALDDALERAAHTLQETPC